MEEDKGSVSANDDDDLVVNEGGKTIGSLKSSEKEKWCNDC